jgi:hypothetical protein
MLDGELIYVSPADLLHGTQHVTIAALIAMHVRKQFRVAADMLTRTSLTSDVAPDVSVLPRALDPRTGKRQLEHLSFELVSTQSMSNAARKAALLAGRGVRRVFAIDVKRQRVLEWAARRGEWRLLGSSGPIEDLVFAVPLRIEAVLSSAAADDEVQRALARKRNPVFRSLMQRGRAQARKQGEQEGRVEGRVEGRREGRKAGRAEGRRQGRREGARRGQALALLALLGVRGVAVSAADRKRILGEQSLARLERWVVRAATCTRVAEIFATP